MVAQGALRGYTGGMQLRSVLRPTLWPSLALALLLSPAAATADGGERIVRYDVDLHVRGDAVLEVRETIVYDFDLEPNRHGIYRDIPLRVAGEGGARKIRLHFGDVRDEAGHPVAYQSSITNGFQREQIGSKDVVVTGQRTYVLTYTLDRATVAAEDRDPARRAEGNLLLWNSIGTGWDSPIGGGSTTLRIDGADAPIVTCETGAEGVVGQRDCTVTQEGGVSTVALARALRPHEGLTVRAHWPAGTTTFPSSSTRLLWLAQEHWGAGVLVLALALLLRRYLRSGRDPAGRSTIIAEYDAPPGLTPAEVGTLVDEAVDNDDLTSTIVDLAARGYLRIVAVGGDQDHAPDDYRFVRLHPNGPELKAHEELLINRLFQDGEDVTLSSLKQKMAPTWQAMRSGLYRSMTNDGYFTSNPAVVRASAIGVGTALIVAGIPLAVLSDTAYSSLLTAGCVAAAGLACVLASRALPAKTAAGVAALEHTRGLERYLTVAEQARLKFEEAEQRYSKLLPYALALGVAALWSKRFEGLLKQAPDWYQGPTGSSFSPALFATSMHQFGSATSAALSAPAPSSSGGGGGVGGGGGGGGGGSW